MKTVVGLFDDMEQAKRAALDVEAAGVPHNDISIVANNEGGRYARVDEDNAAAQDRSQDGHAIGRDAVIGAEIGGVAGLLIGITGLAIPGIGWLAGAGWLWATLIGAGTGAVVGGLVGALTDVGVPPEEASHYNEGVRRGGTLIAVKAQDAIADRVAQILGDDGAVDIDQRAEQYRQEGYSPYRSGATGASTLSGTGASGLGTSTLGTPGTAGNAQPTGTGRGYGSAEQSGYVDTFDARSTTGMQTGAAGASTLGAGVPPLPSSTLSGGADTDDTREVPVQHVGRDYDGTRDTRGIGEKVADAVTGDRIDDKTGKPVS